MTQDLKLTVYGLATDGSDGTNLYFFDTEKDRDDSIWETITPEDEWNENDTDQLPVDPVEYRARFNGDWSDAYDHYRPEYLTLSLNEYTIDLSTVPAVAALVERVKVLEAALAPAEGVIEWAIDNGGNKAALTAIHAMVKAALAAKEGGAA